MVLLFVVYSCYGNLISDKLFEEYIFLEMLGV